MKTHIHTYDSTAREIGPMASWPKTMHQFEREHILALQAAQATGRPLLLCGEAGTGKSQLAHAAAFVTGRAFLPVVVGSHTEAPDLHWKFDAIARLADAHMAANQRDPHPHPELHPSRYLQPGALWWALNWQSAQTQQALCHHGGALKPDTPQGWTPQQGLVLLIDEIDKAEPDLPNGLLEVFANGAFDVPLLGLTVRRAPDCPPPLIIITTNEERELPAAFLRRCLVMTLRLPEEEQELHNWLIERGKMHYHTLPQASLGQAAQLLVADRNAARAQRGYLPGLAEYLDLLRALEQLGPQGLEMLPELKHFFFEKQAGVANTVFS